MTNGYPKANSAAQFKDLILTFVFLPANQNLGRKGGREIFFSSLRIQMDTDTDLGKLMLVRGLTLRCFCLFPGIPPAGSEVSGVTQWISPSKQELQRRENVSLWPLERGLGRHPFSSRALCKLTNLSRLKVVCCGYCNSRSSLVRLTCSSALKHNCIHLRPQPSLSGTLADTQPGLVSQSE